MTDAVNHPPHYIRGGMECIDAIRAALGAEGFRFYCQGSVIKYSFRAGHKGSASIDFAKAETYSRWASETEVPVDPRRLANCTYTLEGGHVVFGESHAIQVLERELRCSAELGAEIGSNGEIMLDLRNKLDSQRANLGVANAHIEDLKGKLVKAHAAIEEFQDENRALRAGLLHMEDMRENAVGEVERLRSQLDFAHNAHEDTRKMLGEINDKLNAKCNDLAWLKLENGRLNIVLDQSKKELEKQIDLANIRFFECNQYRDALQNANEDRSNLRGQLAATHAALEDTIHRLEASRKNLADTRKCLDNTRNDLAIHQSRPTDAEIMGELHRWLGAGIKKNLIETMYDFLNAKK